MYNYKIIKNCFGTRKTLLDGKMDESEFSSHKYKDYLNGTGGNLATQVAKNYGAKPIGKMLLDGTTIEIYDLLHQFGIRWELPNGMYGYPNEVIRNTASPSAICELVEEQTKELRELYL